MSLLDWGIPSTGTKALNALFMVVGGLLGWAVSPLLWLKGPFAWTAYLLASAAQESGFEAGIPGDGGDSVGILQFNIAGVGSLYPESARTSPFWSGFYAARYVSAALLAARGWWWWHVPVLGYAVHRYMWYGFGLDGSALTGAWARLTDGHAPRAVRAYVVWTVLLSPLTWLWWAGLVVLVVRLRKGGRW